jgi:hypothetical protein
MKIFLLSLFILVAGCSNNDALIADLRAENAALRVEAGTWSTETALLNADVTAATAKAGRYLAVIAGCQTHINAGIKLITASSSIAVELADPGTSRSSKLNELTRLLDNIQGYLRSTKGDCLLSIDINNP